jgi:diacylglycerol O-acyltransferase
MHEMSGLDARFLYGENPTVHMHTIKVIELGTAGRSTDLARDEFVRLLGERLDRLPALRRRVVPVPLGLGHPICVDDPDFDLADHVTFTRAQSASRRALAEIVGEVASVQLPRDQPLWNATVVSGLAQDHVAVIIKIHHALADGGAALAMLENAFMLDDDEAVVDETQPEPLPTAATRLRLAGRHGLDRFGRLPGFVSETSRGLARRRRSRRAIEQLPPRPFDAPRSVFSAPLTPERAFAVAELDLGTFFRIRSQSDTSINSVYLAVCGGALRRFLERRDELPSEPLVASVPIGTGTRGGHLVGNHTDNMFVTIGTDVDDPLDRLQQIHQIASSARQLRRSLGEGLLEARAAFIPPQFQRLTTKAISKLRPGSRMRPPVNLIASNVAGPRDELALDGTRVVGLHSVGPLLESIGLNLTAWSYVDSMSVSVLACPSTLPDPWELVSDLEASLDELDAASARAEQASRIDASNESESRTRSGHAATPT